MTTPRADWETIYPASEVGVERMIVAMFDHLGVELAHEMGWPQIATIHRQFRLGRGIADIVLEHADQSITLIEVKRDGQGLRDYCTGIGQLMYQSVMAASHFQTADVRCALALPGPVSVDIVFACARAEMDILPVPTISDWIGFIGDAERERGLRFAEAHGSA